MPSSGIISRVALVRNDVSEERVAFVIWLTRLGERGTTLAVTSNRRKVGRKRLFLQEPHGVTSKNKVFLIVMAAKTSNIT
jgi:hypothetical protein